MHQNSSSLSLSRSNLFPLLEGGVELGSVSLCVYASFHCWTEKLFFIAGLKSVTIVNMTDITDTEVDDMLYLINSYLHKLTVGIRLQVTLFT